MNSDGVRSGDSGGQSPHVTMRSPKEVLQESCSCFRSKGVRPILLKPAIPYILFQEGNELSQKT